MKRFLILLLLPALVFFVKVPVSFAESIKLSDADMKRASAIYFNRCTGCHGTLRKGATGPNLEPKNTLEKGTDILQIFITEGTDGGMPAWVTDGILTEAESLLLAKFVQNPPVAPPEMSLSDMKNTWRVIIPVNKRPRKPMHGRNWQNFFGVVLRDEGKIAIIDGDKKDVIAKLDSGFATHILRTSASGRYFYSIGRDGKAGMYDTWASPPNKVAQVQLCTEARSIDTSKYKGYEDKLAVVGCYWPPHFVVLNGATLEPMKVVSTRSYTYDTNEYHPEPRVAAIVSSHFTPEWVLNIKETGYIWLVDYSDVVNMKITAIPTERFLHDGGWDATKRYFITAANKRNTMVVIDTKTRKKVAQFKVGKIPHPGRGANWVDPKYGPVTATVHIGEARLSVWGSDPKGHPKYAWKVVYDIDMTTLGIGITGGGMLFLKTHPKSPHVWVDLPLNTDKVTMRSMCVFKKANMKAKPKCFEIGDSGRAVHQEYNKGGDEVWVSLWRKKGEVVIYDDKTLTVKKRIKGLMTPTGKFNVYNTMKDIY